MFPGLGGGCVASSGNRMGWMLVRSSELFAMDVVPSLVVLRDLSSVSPVVPVILNPASGPVSAETRQRRIEDALASAGRVCRIYPAADRGHWPEMIARIRSETGSDRLLVCGGDGTVGAVLAATAGSGIAVGIVPGGTGNQLARNLGIPLEIGAAVRVALEGSMVPMDLAVTDRGEWLCQMGGMGVDARMVADVDSVRKGRWGVAAYVWAAVRNLGPHRFRVRLRFDHGKIRRRKVSSILIANAGRLLGALEPIPGASPHDGALHIGVVKSHTPLQWIRLAASLAAGRVSSDPGVEIVRATHVSIETTNPEPFEIDGELLGDRSRVEFTVLPGAARVVVPRQHDSISPSAGPLPTSAAASGSVP